MIWLIGNKGMLGRDVEKLLKQNHIDYISSDKDVDIVNFDELKTFVKNITINWIINCAAYTNVDKAEDEEDLTFNINSIGVKNIAKVAQYKNSKIIHISTDYVFDGKKNAYTESDSVNPINVYGKSKLESEKHIISHVKNYFIIRTSWLYGNNGKNFVYTMMRLFDERDSISVVNDQFGSPTYTIDLANFLLKIIQINSSDYGIYHFANKGKTTWYEFAKEIYRNTLKFQLTNKKVIIEPVSSDFYKTKAKRPANSFLVKDNAIKTFNFEIPNWQESLKHFFLNIELSKK